MERGRQLRKKSSAKAYWPRTIIRTLATLISFQALNGQTTQSRCIDPSNVTDNSLSCNVIQTVTVPQSRVLEQILDVLMLGLGAFAFWIALLYVLQKTDFLESKR